VWHLPNDAPRTTRELVDVVYKLAGQPTTKVRSTPVWMLRTLGMFNHTVRELVEMNYEFTEPFVVDSTAITTELGVRATPVEEALTATMASYR